MDVNLQELDQVLDQAREAPLSEPDYQKIKSALHALAELLTPSRNTEKTGAVLAEVTGTGTPDKLQARPDRIRNRDTVATRPLHLRVPGRSPSRLPS
jgi:hypothetical protein